MKAALTVIAELVRSIVLGGLAAAGTLLVCAGALGVAVWGLWRCWRRARG